MSKKTRAALKAFFQSGDVPTQAQFEDLIDSFKNLTDSISSGDAGKIERIKSDESGWENVALEVDSVVSLKAIPTANLKDGTTVYLRDYYSNSEGGSGRVEYDSTLASFDDGLTFAANDGNGGWKRNDFKAKIGIVNVDDFGAKGDGSTDDSSAFQAALDSELYIKLSDKQYYLASGVSTTQQSLRMEGIGGGGYFSSPNTEILSDQAITMFDFGDVNSTNHRGPHVRNITFRDTSGTGAVNVAINFSRMNQTKWEDLYFMDFSGGTAMQADAGSDAVVLVGIYACKFRNCKYGFKPTGSGDVTSVYIDPACFFVGNSISGGIGFELDNTSVFYGNVDTTETAVKLSGDGNRVSGRLEGNTTCVQIAGGDLNQVYHNIFTSSTNGVVIESTVGQEVIIGPNNYDSVSNPITNNLSAGTVYSIFEPNLNKYEYKGIESGGDIEHLIQNERQAFGEHVRFLASANRGGIQTSLEAYFNNDFTEARIGSKTDHKTAIITKDEVVARFHRKVSIAQGSTAMLLMVNEGGTFSIKEVTMGSADSGGTGYKVLRVPN